MTWLLLISCSAHPDAPPLECVRMCESAQSLYGQCLAGWGLGWPDAGFEDGQDYQESCETWTWELLILEQSPGQTQAFCVEREALITGPQSDCDSYTELEWGGLL